MRQLLLAALLFISTAGLFAQESSAQEQATPQKATTELAATEAQATNATDALQMDSASAVQIDSTAAAEVAPEAQTAVLENPYAKIITERNFTFNIWSILRGLLGMLIVVAIAWAVSLDRKHVDWPTVLKALALQLIIAVGVLLFPAVQTFFEICGKCFVAVLDWTKAGSDFLFSPLTDTSKFGFIFVFNILPTIIFFSALTSLLFYLGVLQKVVYGMGWCLSKVIRLSGAESLSCAGNIFLGQTEAPLMVKEFIPSMTKSEIMLIMTSGMATMAGGVLAAYIGMLGGGDKLMEVEFAKHLLSASVMAAPGAVAMAKIIMPQREEIDNKIKISSEKLGKNVLDAISNGATDGLRLAANVAAMLLVFYALIAGFNYIFGIVGGWTGLNGVIADATEGRFTSISLQFILAYVFYPVIWLTGIEAADLPLVGQLLGEKIIMTEFVGYQSLATMMQTGAFASAKSAIMATYILCGFSNFASVGIQIGGIGGMAPNQKALLSSYGIRALIGATMVALVSAAMVGMFLA